MAYLSSGEQQPLCHPIYKYRCAVVKALWPLWRLPRTKRICSEALFFEIPQQPAPLEPFPPTTPSWGHTKIWPPPWGHWSVSSSRRPGGVARWEETVHSAATCSCTVHPPSAIRFHGWLSWSPLTPTSELPGQRGDLPPVAFPVPLWVWGGAGELVRRRFLGLVKTVCQCTKGAFLPC